MAIEKIAVVRVTTSSQSQWGKTSEYVLNLDIHHAGSPVSFAGKFPPIDERERFSYVIENGNISGMGQDSFPEPSSSMKFLMDGYRNAF